MAHMHGIWELKELDNSMLKKRIQTCMLLLVCLSLLLTGAYAETVRGNLTERFDGMIEKYEHNGVIYRLRNRTSAVLALAVDEEEHGLKLFRFARLLLVDDDNKVFAMLNIPENTLIQVTGNADGELWNMRFGDVFQLPGTADENCLKLMEAVNRLLGQDLLENYIAFDLEGGAVLNGGAALTGTTREKLSALKTITDAMTTDELNEVYADLGDYIITNMKSGAVMKIIDKADRYERQDTVAMPGMEAATANNGSVFVVDAQQLLEIKLAFFYAESTW